MSILEAAIDEQFDAHAKTVLRIQSLRETARMVAAGIARFGGRLKIVNVFQPPVGLPYAQWIVAVSDFREAAPIIEFIEDWTPANLSCNETLDWPNQLVTPQREFKFGDGFRLCCELRDDSASCKAVMKGYKEPEPIYEFECAELA